MRIPTDRPRLDPLTKVQAARSTARDTPPVQKLILTHYLAPGDVVMLTAAVRDLHHAYPGRFITDVRTSCPALWENNPYLTPLDLGDPEVRAVHCHYPLIHQSNQRPVHFLEGFIEFLNETLGLRIQLSRFHGDIHLSRPEKRAPSLLRQGTGLDLPYWIIVAGGKRDFTIKWWHFRRWQAVVDHFRGRLLFVQVGEACHYHPPLRGVVDLRGRTSLRDLVRLVYRAEGVLCPVTLVMHLAAAVECPPGGRPVRPCVVVAGGREPPHWEAYPHHQFIHTVGALPCCAAGGCWRSRIMPLGDRNEKDHPQQLCQRVVSGLPACMAMVTPEEVCRRIEFYLSGSPDLALTPHQARRAQYFLRRRESVLPIAFAGESTRNAGKRAGRDR